MFMRCPKCNGVLEGTMCKNCLRKVTQEEFDEYNKRLKELLKNHKDVVGIG